MALISVVMALNLLALMVFLLHKMLFPCSLLLMLQNTEIVYKRHALLFNSYLFFASIASFTPSIVPEWTGDGLSIHCLFLCFGQETLFSDFGNRHNCCSPFFLLVWWMLVIHLLIPLTEDWLPSEQCERLGSIIARKTSHATGKVWYLTEVQQRHFFHSVNKHSRFFRKVNRWME